MWIALLSFHYLLFSVLGILKYIALLHAYNQWIKYYPHFVYEESLRESHVTRINDRILAQVHLILFFPL